MGLKGQYDIVWELVEHIEEQGCPVLPEVFPYLLTLARHVDSFFLAYGVSNIVLQDIDPDDFDGV